MRILQLATLAAIGVLCVTQSLSAAPARSVQASYIVPKASEYRVIHDVMRSRRVLERLASVLAEFRLPERLTLKLDECDGVPNAWYDPGRSEITICYEYLHDIVQRAPERESEAGVTRLAALVGPVSHVFLHEAAHALFHQLRVPILGREEDAADQVATLIILRLKAKQAREIVEGSAFLLASLSKEEAPEKDAFADTHGLSAQRFFNLVCLAYGSDQKAFAYVVERGFLPEERAEVCGEEYEQARYAFRRLLAPHLSRPSGAVQRVRRAFNRPGRQ